MPTCSRGGMSGLVVCVYQTQIKLLLSKLERLGLGFEGGSAGPVSTIIFKTGKSISSVDILVFGMH